MTGAVLYFIFKFLSSSLSIDASRSMPPKHRTTAEFRASRRQKKDRMLAHPAPPSLAVLDKAPSVRRRGLLSQTIVEEEDSDF
jgi:hypothetical protein